MKMSRGTKKIFDFCIFLCVLSLAVAFLFNVIQPKISITEDKGISFTFGDRYPPDVTVIEWDYNNTEKSRSELLTSLRNLEDSVCIVGNDNISWEDIGHTCFWLSSIKTSKREGDSYMMYFFSYNAEAEENKIMTEEVNAAAWEILSLIPQDADEWEAARIIHDELVERITFDKSGIAPHTHDMYGALVNNECVCQGYCYAFEYIENLRGAECLTVASNTHGWNKLLSINSESCYIDVTWDDLDNYDESGNHYINHDYFFLTKEEIESLESHQSVNDKTDFVIPDPASAFEANYHKYQGWFMNDYSEELMTEIMREQYEGGYNVLTIRFADYSDYENAYEESDHILQELGYIGKYSKWKNESLNIINIGLDPA